MTRENSQPSRGTNHARIESEKRVNEKKQKRQRKRPKKQEKKRRERKRKSVENTGTFLANKNRNKISCSDF